VKLSCFPLLLLAAAFSTTAFGATAHPPLQTMPLVLEKNQGQASAQVRYLARHGTIGAYFTKEGVEFAGPGAGDARISWRLTGSATGVEPVGRKPLPSRSNYFTGSDASQWARGIENDSEVVYPRVYPGIDLVFHGAGGDLEHDFRIAPGSDPALIAFRLEGGLAPVMDPQGNLEIPLGAGKMVLHKPLAYQESAQGRTAVEAAFLVDPSGTVRFRLGSFDPARELVIDPVFGFSSYLAGTGADRPMAVTTDAAGNVYVTGSTSSTDFPLKNPLQKTAPQGGNNAVFVSKFDSTGKTLLFSTYLGGGSDAGYAIALDKKGNIVVAGVTGDSSFPHAGELPAVSCNGVCYFLVSLTSSGGSLNYAGEAGGEIGESYNSAALAIDASGNAYLAGVTGDSAFLTTPGVLDPVSPGYYDDASFVLKVNAVGKLIYSTIIPGLDAYQAQDSYNNVFMPYGIAVDAKGQVTVAGTGGPGLPTTSGAISYNFPNDAANAENVSAGFIFQLNDTASALNYATYLPGTDEVNGFTQDKLGNSWVAGTTWETDLPTTAGAYQPALWQDSDGNCGSGFVMEVDGSGKSVLAATYLQGASQQSGCGSSFHGIALDSNSNVYVGGYTETSYFPLQNPFVITMETDGTEAALVLAGLNSKLSTLIFGSFLSAPDSGDGFNGANFGAMTVDSSGDLIVVGSTNATDFPTTKGSFEPAPPAEKYGESQHGFVAKLNMTTPAPSACLDTPSLSWGAVAAGAKQSATADLINCGNAPLHVKSIVSSSTEFTVKDSCSIVAAGARCPITVTYAPTSANQTIYRTITITDDAQIGSQTIQLYASSRQLYLSASPSTVTFGNVLVGTKAGGQQVTITWSPVQITSVSVLGEFAIVQDNCIGWLPPLGCTITLSFSPVTAGLRAGELIVTGNEGVGVTVPLFGIGDSSKLAPAIGSLTPAAIPISGHPQTITVSGWNFYPGSVVKFNGVGLPTSFVNDQTLTATLAPSVLSAPGTAQVTVFNSAPGGGSSDPATLTAFRIVQVDATALAAVPGGNKVYATVPSSARANANTVIPINAVTGAAGSPIPVGRNPVLLSATADGKYLYVASNGSLTVERINLATSKVERSFPYPNPSSSTCQGCDFSAATDLQAMPGDSLEVAVAFPTQAALYNDKGLVNYAPQTPVAYSPVHLQSLAFTSNPVTLFGLGWWANENADIYTFSVGSKGLTFVPPASGGNWPSSYPGTQMVSDGTLVYTNTGLVLDPLASVQVGTVPFPNNSAISLFFDNQSNTLYTIGYQQVGNKSYPGLEGYRANGFSITGTLNFPQESQNSMNDLIRWGNTGLAFLAETDDPQYEQVFLLNNSPVVTAGNDSKPQLTSIFPSSVTQFSGATTVLLTGSGFRPDTVVDWNGIPLSALVSGSSTQWLSPNAMQAVIPAGSLHDVGSYSLSLSNPAPGGGDSAALPFKVSAPAPALAVSSTALSFGQTKAGTASAAQTLVLMNTGQAYLQISGITVSGANGSSFNTLNSTCGHGLVPDSICTLQVVFKPAGTGVLSATLHIATNAAGSPLLIALTGTGK
jgi:hypothetical protein